MLRLIIGSGGEYSMWNNVKKILNWLGEKAVGLFDSHTWSTIITILFLAGINLLFYGVMVINQFGLYNFKGYDKYKLITFSIANAQLKGIGCLSLGIAAIVIYFASYMLKLAKIEAGTPAVTQDTDQWLHKLDELGSINIMSGSVIIASVILMLLPLTGRDLWTWILIVIITSMMILSLIQFGKIGYYYLNKKITNATDKLTILVAFMGTIVTLVTLFK